MDFQVRITETALADLHEILAYSWERFPSTTEQFGSAILDHLEILRSLPYLGRPVSGWPGVRQLVHTPVLIFYRVLEDQQAIEVLRLWHGVRQPPPLS